MKKILSLYFLIFSSLLAGEINIAASANVSFVLEELTKKFEQTHESIKVRVTIGSSGKLTAQIKNGAPFGIFLSADLRYPTQLYNDGIALRKPVVYAEGMIALFSAHKRDFSKRLKLLELAEIKKIAVANPKTAPYGKAAMEAMKSIGIYKSVKSKLIYAESVSQTLSYATKATDLGIVALSMLKSPRMKSFKEGVNWQAIDSSLYAPIKQGVVLLKGSTDEYKFFYDYLLSKEAQNIFKKYGYK